MKKTLFVTIIFLLFLTLCSSRQPRLSSGRQMVYVSIPPLKHFTEKICGDRYDVKVLIPSGASPHNYEPKPSQMTELSRAQVYFSIGLEMENAWVSRIRKVNPAIIVVAADSGVEKIRDAASGMHGINKHEDDGEKGFKNHSHNKRCGDGEDPHIWLSPLLVKHIARRIAKTLAEWDTAYSHFYYKRLAGFESEIDSLRKAIADSLDRCSAKKSFLTYHPSWGYFAAEFGLNQISIETEGKEPSIRELKTIVDSAKSYEISVLLVQPQISKKIAETIGDHLDIRTIEVDPLAENWSRNLLYLTGILCSR